MDFFIHICVAQSFFGFVVLLLKKPIHISNRILGVWLLCNGLLMTGEMIDQPVVNFFKPGLFPLLLTFGPFLYLYVCSMTTENPTFTKVDLLHFIPFFIVVIHRSFTDPISMGQEDINTDNPAVLANRIYQIVAVVSLVSYWLVSLIKLTKHKKNIVNIFSYQSSNITLNWLRFVIFMFFFIYVIGFILPSWFSSLNIGFLNAMDSLVLSFTFFAFAISLFGINQQIIYSKQETVEEDKLNIDSSIPNDKKYQKSGLSKMDGITIQNAIVQHLTEKKPFLDAEYTIHMLSEELEISRHHITQVINNNLNKNFYALINEMRVEEVILRMKEEKYSNFTLLAIAFDAGFNSKSAFNRIFKLTTGKTPSEYKTKFNT